MNIKDEHDNEVDASSVDWVQIQSSLGALFGIASSISLLSIILSGAYGSGPLPPLLNLGWLASPVIVIAFIGLILSTLALFRYRTTRKRSNRNQSYVALKGLTGLLLNGLVLLVVVPIYLTVFI